MRKEVEVKARVKDIQSLVKKLEGSGVLLSEPIIQNDETFVDDNFGDYATLQSGKNVLRIRESKGKYIFNIKQPQSNEFDCYERETEIADAKELKEGLLLMGYKPVVQIHKKRRKAKYKDYEICVDEVEGLGAFIEVEKITENEDADAVQKELFEYLKQFNISENDRETHGYDTLIYLKRRLY